MHRSSKLWSDANKFVPERWSSLRSASGSGSSGPSHTAQYDGMTPALDLSLSAAAIMHGKEDMGKAGDGAGTSGAGGSKDGSKDTGKDASGGAPDVTPAAFMPFGMGQRSCLGQVFVQVRLKQRADYCCWSVVTTRCMPAPGQHINCSMSFKVLRGRDEAPCGSVCRREV